MASVASLFTPTEASLAHRAHIAQLIAPHRRVRPHTPFWNLRVHRVPTLWSLYRGLLRESPNDDVRWRIRMVFEKYRHLTSPGAVREQLLKYHRWAEIFAKARAGDAHLQAVLIRYSKMIAAKRDVEEFKGMLRKEFEWQSKLRHRPILTGAYLRPTVNHGPLPRMKPQPEHISGMITRRIKAANRHYALLYAATDTLDDLKHEKEFEEQLAATVKRDGVHLDSVYSGHFKEWVQPINEAKRDINRYIGARERRRGSPYPPALLEQIKQARREKVANKTRERQREARGEILPRTIFRSRGEPPAHVLVKMTPLQKHLDNVSRSNASEVGYVGMAKRRLGWKLRNPEAWKAENGKEENLKSLKATAKDIRRQNELKRKEIDDDVKDS